MTSDSVIPGAGNVRITHRGVSQLSINYAAPPDWILLDLYAYFTDQGWERDREFERTLLRGWSPDIKWTFAIFVRQSLFGHISEIAIIKVNPQDSRLYVRLLRCITLETQRNCS